MTTRHPFTTLAAALLLASACQPTGEDRPAVKAAPIAGMYEVTGTTIETETGRQRGIEGSVILAEDGDRYTATFHLNTVFEGEEGVLPAEVIGQGSGEIDGRTLRGGAETQLVISSVPGIDPAFAFIPRATTTRIVSQSVTSIADDGSVAITIENEPAAGEVHPRSRTSLRGRRVDSGTLPAVAAGRGDVGE